MSDPTFVDPAAPAVDPFGDLIALLALFKDRDAIEAAARQLCELEIRIAVEKENLADAQAERGDFDARAAALDQREAALELLEHEQSAKFDDARAELVAHHRRLVEIESGIKMRLLHHAGALAGFDARLQSVPSWSAVDRLIGNVRMDEVATEVPMQTSREGFGSEFSEQSTLTRSVPMSDLPTPSAKRRSRRGAEAP